MSSVVIPFELMSEYFSKDALSCLMLTNKESYDNIQKYFHMILSKNTRINICDLTVPDGFNRWYCIDYLIKKGTLMSIREHHCDVLEIILKNKLCRVLKSLTNNVDITEFFFNLSGCRTQCSDIKHNGRLRLLLKYKIGNVYTNEYNIFDFICSSAPTPFRMIASEEIMLIKLRSVIKKMGGPSVVYNKFVTKIHECTSSYPIRYITPLTLERERRSKDIFKFVLDRLLSVDASYKDQIIIENSDCEV